jgi:ABC-type antimicrobial peptide transport system permease subunit
MTFWTLTRRSLRFHARSHLGVVLGATIGSAALVGALVVGDSVHHSLREKALERLDNAFFALAPADRVFTVDLPAHPFSGLWGNSYFTQTFPRHGRPNPEAPLGVTLLAVSGMVALPSGHARVNHVEVFGVWDDFWQFAGASNFAGIPQGGVVINQSLADQLGALQGREVILRVSHEGQPSLDSAIAPRGRQSLAFSAKIAGVLPPERGGDLSLRSGGAPAMNAFVRADELSALTGLKGRANLWLVGPIQKVPVQQNLKRSSFLDSVREVASKFFLGHPYRALPRQADTYEALRFLGDGLQRVWTLGDVGLVLQPESNGLGIELRSSQVFLERHAVEAAIQVGETNAVSILTYLANLIAIGTNTTPYSMITAAGPPYTPPDMADDEILINQWIADDLHATPGDIISVSYFDPDSGARLVERTNAFRIRAIVSMEPPWSDKTLMPDFPGIQEAETARDWDAGFPLTYKIRPKDEAYWKQYRGTPKAFITLAAGQKIWANRFGALTAIRFPDLRGISTSQHLGQLQSRLLSVLKPDEFGLRFEPVREQALKAADQSQDFGQLFLGFSIFLVVAALLLMALLFQFALEQRAPEVGTLLALGFTPRQVRRLLLLEGATLALAGGIIGTFGGLAYAKAMLWGLTTIWRSAVGTSSLNFHASSESVLIGMCAGTVIACLTIWFTLRKQARQPARELLAGEVPRPKGRAGAWPGWVAAVCGLGAIGTVSWALWKQETANAEAFFSAGSLVLIAGLAITAGWLAVLGRKASAAQFTLPSLGVRSCARRRKRSLATMALLASGCFVILAIGVFRLDANRDASLRTSGTGGFALLGESTLPVTHDLNTRSGREAFGLAEDAMSGIRVVPFRVRDGDEASCLNLNRAQTPRLLGVRPELLQGRFTFVSAGSGLDQRQAWQLLKGSAPNEIPAIGDANSIQWALGKKIGDSIDYTDEQGRAFKVRLVGAIGNSILQGNLIIDEAAFVKRFPGESGYRMFLLDAPSNKVSEISATLSRALQDVGLELTPSVQRLNAFNAVQNTYLGTFQILGGLGLLLGSAGLGVVVLRNVLERRGELAVLLAMGFRRRLVQKLVLTEHGALLGVGLGLGIIAAAVAVLPALISPERHLPYVSLALTLAAVLLNGAFWTWAAIRYALRGNLLEALRNE